MKILTSIIFGGALILSACAPQVEEAIAECEPEIIAYAKDGTPIYAEVEVLGLTVLAPSSDRDGAGGPTTPGTGPTCPPDCPPTTCPPTCPPVVDDKVKCNCGGGNDSELVDGSDCDPGNSGPHNQAGD